ncbi:MAG TPA: hypothetical protein PKA13_21970 [Geminicoccaceae bacterium]|nr:hypothetical protein [Geminicoccus sp.]HMU52462.1 hypothetical protein [Geminicoccaceae bacterium]
MIPNDPIDPPSQPEGRTRSPSLIIDWDLYGQYLADSGLSEADKRALIETLWSIMVSFVDLGFRLSPVAESCGQAGLLDAEATAAGQPVLDCKNITATRAFEGAAADVVATSSDRRPDVRR